MQAAGPLGFWPFASAWMLLWAVAAAVPILIHLWNRRRYQEHTFAAMEYLLAAIQKNSRRIQVEQWILLTIRTLILIFLALALADPLLSIFSPLTSNLNGPGRLHHVLVLDGSLSMDQRPGTGGTNLFETARKLALDVVAQARQGDGFTLVLMADPPQVIIGQPAFDPEDVNEELNSMQLAHAGGSLSATLSEVQQILTEAGRTGAKLESSRIYFFTDLGAASWNESLESSTRTQIARLRELARLDLVDLAPPEIGNLAISRLQTRQSLATIRRSVVLEAAVKNFGNQPRNTRIQFLVDDREIHQETLPIPAGGEVTAVADWRFETPGEHRVEARIEDPGLLVDNHRWLSVPVREAVRVLCIGGSPEDVRHLALALQPGPADQAAVRVDVQPESALLEANLHQYEALFLANVARFSQDEVARLHDYLGQGGGLVVSLGDKVQAENYNEQLGGELSGQRVLPARLEATVQEAQYAFDPLQYRHPIVQVFRDHEQTGLLTTPVWKYFRLTPFDPTAAQIAVAFDNGDPAIIDEPLLRGRSILLATATSPRSLDQTASPPGPWTALSSWPSFVPLVQEILVRAVDRRYEGRNVQVGDPLRGAVLGRVQETSLDLQLPSWMTAGSSSRQERVRMSIDGEDARWVYPATTTSGMYQARYRPPLDRTAEYAVNVDLRESALQRFDKEQLPSQFNQEEVSSDGAPHLPDDRPQRYFRYLLAAVLVLLLSESTLAWYFGNRSA